MESLIGAIFLDSRDLEQTSTIILKLINCPLIHSFPIVQHSRTSILSIFNSKNYCKELKIQHTVEEKDNSIYFTAFMGKLEFRKLKYPKERKRKIQIFYFDLRLYLEDAYKKFETNHLAFRTD